MTAKNFKFPSDENPQEARLDIKRLTDLLVFASKFHQEASPKDSEAVVQKQHQIFMSDQELIIFLNNSNKPEWEVNSVFYCALCEELKKRGLIPDFY
ncbi:MAG: hypothetical protein PHT51_01835 [Patescibacteria group bacterium]|nr:hypothetical protein [Patescibacteria group bacterium]MDD4610361.1 hypothetical protein [Patescibacteria group bacterium]